MNRKEYWYVSGAKISNYGLVFNFASFGGFVLERVMKFRPKDFLALFYVRQPQIDLKMMFRSFGAKPSNLG